MTYKEIVQMCEGANFPLSGTDEEGNNVVIEIGFDSEGEQFFCISTMQSNGWIRKNEYYQDGTICETYER